jgi:hypothetical protein
MLNGESKWGKHPIFLKQTPYFSRYGLTAANLPTHGFAEPAADDELTHPQPISPIAHRISPVAINDSVVYTNNKQCGQFPTHEQIFEEVRKYKDPVS